MRATVLFIDYGALKAIEAFGHGNVEGHHAKAQVEQQV
jgi:hypothetical protein